MSPTTTVYLTQTQIDLLRAYKAANGGNSKCKMRYRKTSSTPVRFCTGKADHYPVQVSHMGARTLAKLMGHKPRKVVYRGRSRTCYTHDDAPLPTPQENARLRAKYENPELRELMTEHQHLIDNMTPAELHAHYTRISELHPALRELDEEDRLEVVERIVAEELAKREERRGAKRKRRRTSH